MSSARVPFCSVWNSSKLSFLFSLNQNLFAVDDVQALASLVNAAAGQVIDDIVGILFGGNALDSSRLIAEGTVLLHIDDVVLVGNDGGISIHTYILIPCNTFALLLTVQEVSNLTALQLVGCYLSTLRVILNLHCAFLIVAIVQGAASSISCKCSTAIFAYIDITNHQDIVQYQSTTADPSGDTCAAVSLLTTDGACEQDVGYSYRTAN